MQYRPIADAITRGGIGRVKHGLQLILQQIRHQALVRLLEWDGQDAADLLQSCRLPVFEEAEEGLDRRQPDIACDGRILARILEVLEEGADEAGIELLQRQLRWPDLQSFCGEHEEQLEAGGIGVLRVPTGTPLAGERLAKERFDEGSDRCHDRLPS
jgi:hypothetical protein